MKTIIFGPVNLLTSNFLTPVCTLNTSLYFTLKQFDLNTQEWSAFRYVAKATFLLGKFP